MAATPATPDAAAPAREKVPSKRISKRERDQAIAARSSTQLPKRTEEDERLVAALVFIDRPAESAAPGPLTTVGGSSLVQRAGAAAQLVGVPRVVLVGANDLDQVKSELARGGYAGPVETWDGKDALPLGERGRVLVLDASGMHDPPAVARLARWKGERAYVLVAHEGDGLRVQVEGNKVVEVGNSLVPFDGVTCGAINAPITLWSRLSELGAHGALLGLARDGLLGASVERRTIAREIASEKSLVEVRQRLMDRVSGGPRDTLLNRALTRRFSRPLTSVLVPLGVPPSAITVVSLLVGLLGAALLSGVGVPPTAVTLFGGVLLLFGSTVLDCVDDEVAAMRVRQDGAWRFLDLCSDGIVTAAALAGLGLGAQQLSILSALPNGLVAAGGALIATVLVVLTRTSLEEGHEPADAASRGAEFLGRRLVNREVTFLVLLVVSAHVLLQALRPGTDGPRTEALEYSLIGLAALAHAYWVALAICVAFRPRK